jgi:hypothetical protein
MLFATVVLFGGLAQNRKRVESNVQERLPKPTVDIAAACTMRMNLKGVALSLALAAFLCHSGPYNPPEVSDSRAYGDG